MQTQVLDTYIDNFTAFNEVPPQLLAFIKGLKALNNDDVVIKKFTFNNMFYTVMVPKSLIKGTNMSTRFRQFVARMLVKKSITEVSVNEFNSVLSQLFYLGHDYELAYAPTYYFLRDTYNDKCRHTVIKYYSLDNPK